MFRKDFFSHRHSHDKSLSAIFQILVLMIVCISQDWRLRLYNKVFNAAHPIGCSSTFFQWTPYLVQWISSVQQSRWKESVYLPIYPTWKKRFIERKAEGERAHTSLLLLIGMWKAHQMPDNVRPHLLTTSKWVARWIHRWTPLAHPVWNSKKENGGGPWSVCLWFLLENAVFEYC